MEQEQAVKQAEKAVKQAEQAITQAEKAVKQAEQTVQAATQAEQTVKQAEKAVKESNTKTITGSKQRLAYTAKVAIMGAAAAIIMLLEFPIPFLAPGFYKLDLSEVAVLVSGFALGPLAGVLTELVKILLNLLINGTQTAFVGEIANFVIGVSFVLPASLIYKYRRTLKGAVIGMVTGTLSLALIGALMNYFVLIPAYVRFFGLPLETIIGMGAKINKGIKGLGTFVTFAVLPFNLIKGVLCSLITSLIYKHISPILKPHKN